LRHRAGTQFIDHPKTVEPVEDPLGCSVTESSRHRCQSVSDELLPLVPGFHLPSASSMVRPRFSFDKTPIPGLAEPGDHLQVETAWCQLEFGQDVLPRRL